MTVVGRWFYIRVHTAEPFSLEKYRGFGLEFMSGLKVII